MPTLPPTTAHPLTGPSQRPAARSARARLAAQDHDRRRRRRRTQLVWGIAALTALTLLGVGLAVGHLRDRDLVATVGGDRVTRAEYLFYMGLADAQPDQSPTALQALSEHTLASIAHDEEILRLARERHLTDIEGFTGWQDALTAENKRRTQALASGEVVYGLQSFDLPTFYAHTMQDLTAQLQRQLSLAPGDPLWVSDAEVGAAYDADPGRWQANVATLTYTELRVPTEAATPQCLTALGAAGAHLEGLLMLSSPCRGAALSTGSLAPSTGSSTPGGPAGGSPTDALRALPVGAATDPQSDGVDVVVLRLDGAQANRSAALATYSSRIRQSLVNQAFSAYVASRAERPTTHLSPRALTDLTTEGIHS